MTIRIALGSPQAKARKRVGYLLSGWDKVLTVDGSGRGYLRAVCDDVHSESVAGQAAAA